MFTKYHVKRITFYVFISTKKEQCEKKTVVYLRGIANF